jgi:hypothetical protein
MISPIIEITCSTIVNQRISFILLLFNNNFFCWFNILIIRQLHNMSQVKEPTSSSYQSTLVMLKNLSPNKSNSTTSKVAVFSNCNIFMGFG